MRRTHSFLISIAMFLAVGPPIVSAQGDTLPSVSVGRQLCCDGMTMVKGAAFVFTAPARWEGGDWMRAGGTLLLTGGSALMDGGVEEFMDRNRSNTADNLEKFTVKYAEGVTIVGVSAGLYAIGLIFSDRWIRETGLLTGTAVAVCGAISTVSKIIVGRARPYAGLGNHEFRPFTVEDSFHSFPSGHTVAAFALSTVLASRIDNPWASVGLYTLAAASSVSRIYSRNHWFSDVVFSAILSTSASRSLLRWYDGVEDHAASHGLEVLPCAGGVAIVWRF